MISPVASRSYSRVMGSLRSGNRVGLLVSAAVVLTGVALMAAATAPSRHAPAGGTPQVDPTTACTLAVMQQVPVPAPADMTFTNRATQPAAGGGYRMTGIVDAHPSTGPTLRAAWACDVELRHGAWYPWYTSVTPMSSTQVVDRTVSRPPHS